MKRIILFGFLLVVNISFCQLTATKHQILLKKADSLYKAKEYKNAALIFSNILQIQGLQASIWDWNNAAFCWSKAGFPDSALSNLEMIAEIDTISFSDYLDITTDPDYLSLHGSSRWIDIRSKLFNNAKEYFYAQLKTSDEKANFRLKYYAALAWVGNRGYDSAFLHLSKLAVSNALTIEYADEILKNENLKELHSDAQWRDLLEKLFLTLNKKYIPLNSFRRGNQKKILIDGAHNNFHDINGTYEVLSGMLRKKGFVVTGQTKTFDENNLNSVNLLIIANPLSDRMDSLTRRAQRSKEPYRWSTVATQSAYTKSEIAAIKNWVYSGGSLLLVLDHAPIGKSGGSLAEAFGVDSRNVGTYDTLSLDPKMDTANGARNILFTRSNGLIGSHPIMTGVDSVTTYTGLSLMGPQGSSVLLHLPSTAYDRDWLPETRQFRNRTAAGRSQGIAFEFGKGRVVVMGEAAEFRPAFASRSERGNWKLLLNILKWLAKVEMN